MFRCVLIVRGYGSNFRKIGVKMRELWLFQCLGTDFEVDRIHIRPNQVNWTLDQLLESPKPNPHAYPYPFQKVFLKTPQKVAPSNILFFNTLFEKGQNYKQFFFKNPRVFGCVWTPPTVTLQQQLLPLHLPQRFGH